MSESSNLEYLGGGNLEQVGICMSQTKSQKKSSSSHHACPWTKLQTHCPGTGYFGSKSLKTSFEVDSVKGATFHGLLNILLKHPAV